MHKSGYTRDVQNAVSVNMQAEKDTCIQFMVDTLILTLNDREVMGKDVFGKKRIEKVVSAWMEKYDLYHPAVERGPKADYYQDKLDDCLVRIIGEKETVRFPERYPWINKQTYSKRK